MGRGLLMMMGRIDSEISEIKIKWFVGSVGCVSVTGIGHAHSLNRVDRAYEVVQTSV